MDNFRLPSGFTEVQYADGSDYICEILDELSKNDAEVWLIKAPIRTDLKALNGQKLKLDGKSRCKCENDTSPKYEIVHSCSVQTQMKDHVLMIPDYDQGKLRPCSTRISGYLSIEKLNASLDIQCPPVATHKMPFPKDVHSHYVPFGADHPIETHRLKKRKHIAISDDESKQKKKSKKAKHKESLAESSNSISQITNELPAFNKEKRKHTKRHASSEDECDKVMKTAKRTKMEKNCDDSFNENYKNAVKIKEEILSPVRKAKKSKRKESLTEDGDVEKESSFHKKKSKKNTHLDKESDGGSMIESNSSPVDISNRNMSKDLDTNGLERKKHRKHKKEK